MLSIADIAKQYSAEAAAVIALMRCQSGAMDIEACIKVWQQLAPGAAGIQAMMAAHGLSASLIPDAIGSRLRADPDWIGFFAQDSQRASWSLVLFEEQVLLLELFSSLHLPFVFHKGVLLGLDLHGDLTSRQSRDIDIMVLPKDLHDFRDCLRTAGYEELYYFPEEHASYFLWLNREIVFRRRISDGSFVYVELQWAPVLAFYGVPFDMERMMAQRRMLSFGGRLWPLPDQGHVLLMLLLHHGMTDGWRSLSHVYDLSVFLQKNAGYIDWPLCRKQLSEMGVAGIASAGVSLVALLSQADVPDGFEVGVRGLQRLSGTLLSARVLKKDQRSAAFIRRQWLLADGWAGRWRLVKGQWQKFLSPGLVELQSIRLPAKLFPLYYFFKWSRPLWRPFICSNAGKGLHEKQGMHDSWR